MCLKRTFLIKGDKYKGVENIKMHLTFHLPPLATERHKIFNRRPPDEKGKCNKKPYIYISIALIKNKS